MKLVFHSDSRQLPRYTKQQVCVTLHKKCYAPVMLNGHYRPQTKLREVNVFTPVCLFTGVGWVGGGWLLSKDHRSQDRRVCITGDLHQGGSASRGSISRPLLRYMGYYGIWSTSGQYASYWNAFLFTKDITKWRPHLTSTVPCSALCLVLQKSENGFSGSMITIWKQIEFLIRI